MEDEYQFDGQNGPISNSSISDLERIVGKQFPKEYRDFLLQTNGGEDLFAYQNSESQLIEISSFFGIGCDDGDSIAWNLDILSDRFNTKSLLPIASSAAGDIICLNLEDNSLSIWWHERETIERLCAHNFKEFWKGLYIEEI